MWIQQLFSKAEGNISSRHSLSASLNLSKVILISFLPQLCQLALVLVVPLAFSYGSATSANAATLWYGGDPDGQGSTRNSRNIYEPFPVFGARLTRFVLDDFIVPTTEEGWNIDAVWSHNLIADSTRVNGVEWSIEQILPRNIPGERPFRRQTVVGGVSPATIAPTNFTIAGSNYSMYTVRASGLNITLSPGTYWLYVTPQYISSSPTDAPLSDIATTRGSNAIGTPPGNNGNSFELSYGSGFEPGNPGDRDYSMGIEGRVVPEPSSILSLLSFAALTLGFREWHKHKFSPDANKRTIDLN